MYLRDRAAFDRTAKSVHFDTSLELPSLRCLDLTCQHRFWTESYAMPRESGTDAAIGRLVDMGFSKAIHELLCSTLSPALEPSLIHLFQPSIYRSLTGGSRECTRQGERK